MASSSESKKTSGSSQKIIIVGLIFITVLLAAVIMLLSKRQLANVEDGNTPKIGYASDATVFLDEDALQAAMDEAMQNAANGTVALQYKNNAYSDDGVNFECHIVNSTGNRYDAFFAIYTDAEMTDQIFLSGLVRPGSGFEKITLDHALDSGTNVVYVAVTLVDTEEDGTQSIKAQVVHTMDFHVGE